VMMKRAAPPLPSVAVFLAVALALLGCFAAPAHARRPQSTTTTLFDLPLAKLMGLQANAGSTCVACTLVVAVLEQLAEVQNKTVTETVEKACMLLPAGAFRTTCEETIAIFGPTIIRMLTQGFTADEVCLEIKLCVNATCRLFPRNRAFNPPSRRACPDPRGMEDDVGTEY